MGFIVTQFYSLVKSKCHTWLQVEVLELFNLTFDRNTGTAINHEVTWVRQLGSRCQVHNAGFIKYHVIKLGICWEVFILQCKNLCVTQLQRNKYMNHTKAMKMFGRAYIESKCWESATAKQKYYTFRVS